MPRSYQLAGMGIIGVLVILVLLELVNSPVGAMRKDVSKKLAEVRPPNQAAGGGEPDYVAWQATIKGRPALWQPLVKAPARAAEAPNLSQRLAGVRPTRNKMGSKADLKVQIIVDGVKGWYGKGQQVKGCTIKDITDGAIMFSFSQGGQEYQVNVPRQ